MANVLIRGLLDAAIARIDADAASLGLSRNEHLRRLFESERSTAAAHKLTVEDLRRAADAAKDLDDSEVMGSAWR
jgi:hypothetical protein